MAGAPAGAAPAGAPAGAPAAGAEQSSSSSACNPLSSSGHGTPPPRMSAGLMSFGHTSSSALVSKLAASRRDACYDSILTDFLTTYLPSGGEQVTQQRVRRSRKISFYNVLTYLLTYLLTFWR